MGWWRKWFGRRLSGAMYRDKWWGRWWPEGLPPGVVPPIAPSTAASLVLEENVKVTYSWITGVHKSFDGRENRSSILEDPAMRFEGSVKMDESATRSQRAKLARSAAQGSAFSLGIPYEAVPLSQDSPGTTVHVFSTAKLDWCVPGMRAIVRRLGVGSVEVTIQSKTATEIEVYLSSGALGDVGGPGAEIMPAMAVFLDAQQGFGRYQTALERWDIRARNANGGMQSAAVAAELELATVTMDSALAGVTIQARSPGAAGNAITVAFEDDGTTLGSLDEDTGAKTIVVHFSAGNTPVGRLVNMFATSTLARVIGADGSLDKINGTFTASNLAGGIDGGAISPGAGATLTTFLGRPVWDRGLDMKSDETSESIQAMNDPQDLGGLPFTAQTARVPDWGRAVTLSRRIFDQWQWTKKFLWAVKGSCKSWWLPTYRRDLVGVSVSTGTLTVSGDFFAWWPLQRSYLACYTADLTPTYAKIAAAVDNLDGTATLSLVDENGDPVTLAAVPDVISWLEPCRLETDQVTVAFSKFTFLMQLQARVIQFSEEVAQTGFLADEDSVESSAPREGIEFILPAVTYRVATGTRDVTINGYTFTAYPANREEVGIVTSGDTKDLSVRIPLKHAVAQRYLLNGVPPRRVQVNIYRQQQRSGEYEVIFRGDVDSMGAEGRVALFRVVSSVNTLTQTRLPVITVGRLCPHVLYDRNCGLDENDFKLPTTVDDVDGRVVTVATSLPDDYATTGKLKHVASGEQMTLESQLGKVNTMQLAISELKVGDDVEVFAGCDHTIETCRLKFNNRANFGGFPQLNTEQRWGLKGFGIYTQE